MLALGTNGPIDLDVLDEIRDIIGPSARWSWSTCRLPATGPTVSTTTLSAFALNYRDVELANWHDTIQPALNLLAGDQIHFGSDGGRRSSAPRSATPFNVWPSCRRCATTAPNQSLPRPV